jgi:trk system potassium uptake protein TrkA
MTPGKLDVVVAGGGRVGFQTARRLADRGHDVTVIEADPVQCDRISDAYVATVVEGDATNPTVLEQAVGGGCDVVAGLTGAAGANLAVCMEAREFAPEARTVARIDSKDKEAYDRFVDATLYPEQAGARAAVNEIAGGSVFSLTEHTGDLDVMRVEVAEGAPADGKTLAEVRFPEGALVVSDADGDSVATSDTTLSAGDVYVVAAEPAVVDELMNLLRG